MTDDTSGYITIEYEGISSDFTDIEALPSSGTCDLFRAKRYGRWYLLKCLKAKYATDSACQQMLRKEFEIVISLQHTSVMQVTGIEEVSLPGRGKVLCIIAEWIDGRTLNDFLTENPSQRERRRIATELCEAVAYIHSQQVVHRDLKPSNIMITHNGDYVRIIDFGLADTNSHTILKQPAGTLRYMAPEQLQFAVADVRNDIYSLGVVMKQMNLGGGKYRKVVRRCLSPVEERYQNMEALLDDLRSQRRQRLAWGTGVLAVAAVIALLLGQVSHLQQEANEQRTQLRILNHEIIGFADLRVKEKCVQHWDTDGDGQLSYDEAAAVDSLGDVFTGDTLITSFDELEHFTGLESIDRKAFKDCVRLQSVRIPSKTRFIRSEAFRHTGLQQIIIPGAVAGLGDYFMNDCPQLETVIFESRPPNTNVTPESEPFVNCPQLSTVFIPTTILKAMQTGKSLEDKGYNREYISKNLGHYSYIFLVWLTWKAVFPLMTDHIRFADPQVKAICVRQWDRDGDHELSIDEAASVKSLSSAFIAQDEIESFDELRFFTGIDRINASAFELCSHLKSIRIPSSVKVIEKWAFAECKALQEFTIPGHVEQIEHHAFNGCNLCEGFSPASVDFIGISAFALNFHLAKVVVSPDNPVYDSRDNCNAIIETKTNTMHTACVTTFFPRTVDKLADEVFNGLDRDTLTIPRQLKAIGPWALSLNIDTVFFESPEPQFIDHQSLQIFSLDVVIIVPKGAAKAYRSIPSLSLYKDNIRER